MEQKIVHKWINAKRKSIWLMQFVTKMQYTVILYIRVITFQNKPVMKVAFYIMSHRADIYPTANTVYSPAPLCWGQISSPPLHNKLLVYKNISPYYLKSLHSMKLPCFLLLSICCVAFFFSFWLCGFLFRLKILQVKCYCSEKKRLCLPTGVQCGLPTDLLDGNSVCSSHLTWDTSNWF